MLSGTLPALQVSFSAPLAFNYHPGTPAIAFRFIPATILPPKRRFPVPQHLCLSDIIPAPEPSLSATLPARQALVCDTFLSNPNLVFWHPHFHSKPRFPTSFRPNFRKYLWSSQFLISTDLSEDIFRHSKPRFPVTILPPQASLSGTLPALPSLVFWYHSLPGTILALQPSLSGTTPALQPSLSGTIPAQ